MKTTINRAKIKKNPVVPTKESERLKFFRKAEGLSQTELGEALGCHQTQVFKYENGKNIIPLDVVKIIHAKFNMSYDWFYHGTGNPKAVKHEKKLVTNISDMANNILILEQQIKVLKAEIRKIGSDFYEYRNNNLGRKTDN